MSDQGIDKPREIRGPEDVNPIKGGINLDGSDILMIPAQEVVQMLALAMDAERCHALESTTGGQYFGVYAWRSLSDKLKGPSEGKV